MKDAVFDTLFVSSARARLIREGAYTENARIAFENFPIETQSLSLRPNRIISVEK